MCHYLSCSYVMTPPFSALCGASDGSIVLSLSPAPVFPSISPVLSPLLYPSQIDASRTIGVYALQMHVLYLR
jgi:hypothetical protein